MPSAADEEAEATQAGRRAVVAGAAGLATMPLGAEKARAYGLDRPPPKNGGLFGIGRPRGPLKPVASSNLEEAKERGERLREEKAEAETPGELVTMSNGIQYREITTGTSGPKAELGDVLEVQYTVFRLSSGAYFKYSSGGKPVLLFGFGYGYEGQDDVGATRRVTLGTKDLPRAATPAVVGMRRGSRRRILIPPAFGWRDDKSVGPRPETFGAYRRLEQHKDEPLLLEVDVRRVLPGGKETPDNDDVDGQSTPEQEATAPTPLYALPAPPSLNPTAPSAAPSST